MKSLAILLFGQFRSFAVNLQLNLREIRRSFPGFVMDIYILTDKEPKGSYSTTNEQYIRNVLQEYNINLVFLKFYEDLVDFHNENDRIEKRYHEQCKGIEPNTDGYYTGTGLVLHRRYLLNYLFNQECDKNNREYTWVSFMRLFDTKIKALRGLDFIENEKDNVLYFCLDSIFIAKRNVINKTFEYYKNVDITQGQMWDNLKFVQEYQKFDSCLAQCKPTFCSETQLFYYIYSNGIAYKNLRFDYNKANSIYNDNAYLYVVHCPLRKLIWSIKS